jgi:hypothetical protein
MATKLFLEPLNEFLLPAATVKVFVSRKEYCFYILQLSDGLLFSQTSITNPSDSLSNKKQAILGFYAFSFLYSN